MNTQIAQTNDYSLFESITGNRSLNQGKVEKICNDIANGFNMLPYCPIIVSENGGKLQIIDGQHRFEVSKQTQNPVYYVLCQTLTLKQIAQLNSRGEKWKPQDFLNCYIRLGIKDYERIYEIMNEYKINIRLTIDLLMYNKHSEPKSTEVFQSGDFQCNYLQETHDLLKLSDSLFGRYTFSKDRYLIGAVQAIQKKGKCDFDKLRSKIAAAPMMMDKQTDVKNYIYNIERVYNFKSQSREVIY
jgi:hypothetical protein